MRSSAMPPPVSGGVRRRKIPLRWGMTASSTTATSIRLASPSGEGHFQW
jgi:hypothetical protein